MRDFGLALESLLAQDRRLWPLAARDIRAFSLGWMSASGESGHWLLGLQNRPLGTSANRPNAAVGGKWARMAADEPNPAGHYSPRLVR
jgi:hypothetical protein